LVYSTASLIGSIFGELVFGSIIAFIIYLIWKYVIKYPKMTSYSKRQKITIHLVWTLGMAISFGLIPSFIYDNVDNQNQIVTITPYVPKSNSNTVSVNIPIANTTTDPIYIKPITVSPSQMGESTLNANR
jgi:hypothetical protein